MKFLVRFTLFILPIVAFILFTEYKLSSVPNQYMIKRHYFEKQLDSIEVLVDGGSHAAYGLNPAFFSHKAFNLASDAQDFYYDSAIISHFLKKLPKLKLVLLEVNYPKLSYQTYTQPKITWYPAYYYRFWGIKGENWRFYNIDNYSYISLYSIPVVRKIIETRFDTSMIQFPISNSGWEKADSLINKNKIINDTTAYRRVEWHKKLISLGNATKVKLTLENFVRELRDNNIQVVFVDCPVYITYRKFLDSAVIKDNQTYINHICNEYNCRYVNYSSDRHFSISDFYDNDHMNYLGAKKFSKLIDSAIIRPFFNR